MIYQNARIMSCGNCGGDKFSIYRELDENDPDMKTLIVECLKCNSTSLISFTQPKLKIDFGFKSDGVLCILK